MPDTNDPEQSQGQTPTQLTQSQARAQGVVTGMNSVLGLFQQQTDPSSDVFPQPGVIQSHTGVPNQFLEPNLTVAVMEGGGIRVKWGTLTSVSHLTRVPDAPGRVCDGPCPAVYTAAFSGDMIADNGYVASGYSFVLTIQSDALSSSGFKLQSFEVDRPNSNGMTTYSEKVQYQNNRPVHYEEHMVNPDEVDAWLAYDITYVEVSGKWLVQTTTFSTRQQYLGSMADQGTVLSTGRHEISYGPGGEINRTLDVSGYEKGSEKTWFAIIASHGASANEPNTSYWITDTTDDLSGFRLSDWDALTARANVRQVNAYGTDLNVNGYPMLDYSVYSTRDGKGDWKPVMVFEPDAFRRPGWGTQWTMVIGEPDVTSGETDDIWVRGFENIPGSYTFGFGPADDMEGRLIAVGRIRGFGFYANGGPRGSVAAVIDFPKEDLITLDGKNYRLRLDKTTGKIVFTEESWHPFSARISTTTNVGYEESYNITALADGTVRMSIWGNQVLTGKWDPKTLSVTFPEYYGNQYRIQFEHLGGGNYQVKQLTMRSFQHDFRWDFENGLMTHARLTQLVPVGWDFASPNWVPGWTNDYALTYVNTGAGPKVSTLEYRMLIHRMNDVPLTTDYLDNTHKTYFGYSEEGALTSRLHIRSNADTFGDPYYHFAYFQELNSDGSVSIYYGDSNTDYSLAVRSITDGVTIKRDSLSADTFYPYDMRDDYVVNGGFIYQVPTQWIQSARNAAGKFVPRFTYKLLTDPDGKEHWEMRLVVGQADILGGGEQDDKLFKPWQVIGLPDHLAGVSFGEVKRERPHASWDLYWERVGYGLAFYEGLGNKAVETWVDYPNQTRVTLGGVIYDITLNADGAIVLTEALPDPPAVLPARGTISMPIGSLTTDPDPLAGASSMLMVGSDGKITFTHDGLTLNGVAELIGPDDPGCSTSGCAQKYKVVFKEPWARATGQDHSVMTVFFTSSPEGVAPAVLLINSVEARRTVQSSLSDQLVSDRLDKINFAAGLPSSREGHRIDASGVRTEWRHDYTYGSIAGRDLLTEVRSSQTITRPGASGSAPVSALSTGAQFRVYDVSGRMTALIESEGPSEDGPGTGRAAAHIYGPAGEVVDVYRTLAVSNDPLSSKNASNALAAVISAAEVREHYFNVGSGADTASVLTSLRSGTDFVPWLWTSANGDTYFVVGQPDLPGAVVDDILFRGVEGLPADANVWWGLGVGMDQTAGLYFVDKDSYAVSGRPRMVASARVPYGSALVLSGVTYTARLFDDGRIHLTPVAGPVASVSSGGTAAAATALTPSIPLSDQLWWLRAVNAESAWTLSTGQGVTVAVIDTGVDMGHEDLAGNIWTNAAEIPNNGIDDDGNGYIDDVHGWDFVNGDGDAADDQGHGTHVSGIIGALADNGLGIAGIAPNAKILPVKVLDKNGSGSFERIVQGIRYAVDMGARILNLSLGGAFWYTLEYLRQHFADAYEQAVRPIADAIAYAASRGAMIVAAAGNNALNVNHFVPSGIQGTISVGATTSTGDRAFFSNYGMTMDLSAPGYNILSLRAAGTSLGRPLDDHYTFASGTSMAAPMVSGAIALLLAQDPLISIDQINSRLKRSSSDLGSTNYDPWFGAGQIDVYAMLSHDYYDDGTLKSIRLTSPDSNGFIAYDYDPDGRTVRKVAADGTATFFEYWGGSNQLRAVQAVQNGRSISQTRYALNGQIEFVRGRDPAGTSTISVSAPVLPLDLWSNMSETQPLASIGALTESDLQDAKYLTGYRFNEFNDYTSLMDERVPSNRRKSPSRLMRLNLPAFAH